MVSRPLHQSIFFTLLIAATCLIMASPAFGGKSVSATLNTEQVPVDMAAVLTITVEGGNSVDINMPEVDNLRFHRRGQSSQVQMINGSFSASISTVYLVEPLQPGSYTIPAITVHCDGEELHTKPISLEATTGSNQPKNKNGNSSTQARIGSGKGAKITFLRVHIGKNSIYSGEMVPVRIEAYFNRRIQANLNSLPILKGDGFVLSPLGNKPSRSMKLVNNTPYIVLGWNSYLTGIKEGRHPLHFELEAELLMPQRSRSLSRFRNQGFFQNNLFDDFFNDYQTKIVKVVSPDLNLETIPLPDDGRPENFSGAIGNFSLNVSATPTDIEIGEPITLSMTIEGSGNFDRVNVPEFPQSDSWKLYSTSAQFDPQQGRPDKGIKRFEQAVVAKDSQIQEIPSLSFSYFDLVSGHYKQLVSDPIPLTISASSAQKKPAILVQTDKKKADETQTTVNLSTNIEGLAPIKLSYGRLQPSIQPLFLKGWFLTVIIISLCLLCTLFTTHYIRQQREMNPELGRRSLMKKRLGTVLKEIESAKNNKDSKKFLALCRNAIQEQLGLHWQLEPAAITVSDLTKRLESDSTLIKLFQMADYGAYGGLNLSPEEMEQLYLRIQEELGALS